MARVFLAAVAAAVLASAAARVINLDDSSFQRAVGESSSLLVKFYAPWCSHCQAMAPEVDALPAALEGLTNVNGDTTSVARVDCTLPAAHDTCSTLRVGGYPTVKLFTRDSVYAFDDHRTTAALKSFALEGFASAPAEPFVSQWVAPSSEPVSEAESTSVDAVTEGDAEPVRVLVEDASPQQVEQQQEKQQQGDEDGGEREDEAAATAAQMQQQEQVEQQQEQQQEQQEQEEEQRQQEQEEQEQQQQEQQEQQEQEEAEEEASMFHAAREEPLVRELTEETFEHDTQAATGSTTGRWLVEFYAPWCPHCKTFAPQYEKVARALRSRRAPVTVAKVDAAAHPALASRFGVLSFPSLRLIADGRVWAYPADRARSVASVVDFAQSATSSLPSTPVPAPPTLLSQLQEEVTTAFAAATRLASSETQAVSLIAAAGFLGGMLVMLAVTATVMCLVPVQDPRTASAPSQAGLASSVAAALATTSAAQARHHSAKASPSVGPGAGGSMTPPVDGTITPMILQGDLSDDNEPVLGAAASPKPKARRRKGARKSK